MSGIKAKKLVSSVIWGIVRYGFLIASCYLLLYPFLYMISGSFRAAIDFHDPTVNWIPKHISTENLAVAWRAMDYLTERCDSHAMHYDNLPVIDGNCWSGGQVRAGLYPEVCDDHGVNAPILGEISAEYANDTTAEITVNGNGAKLTIVCQEDRITFSLCSGQSERLSLLMRDGKNMLSAVCIEDGKLCYRYAEHPYIVSVEQAMSLVHTDDGIRITSKDHTLTLIMSDKV